MDVRTEKPAQPMENNRAEEIAMRKSKVGPIFWRNLKVKAM